MYAHLQPHIGQVAKSVQLQIQDGRHLTLVGQRQVDGLDLFLQGRDVGKGWADEQDRDRPGLDGPGKLTELANEQRVGQPIWDEIRPEVAQDVQTGLDLRDVLQNRDRVPRRRERAFRRRPCLAQQPGAGPGSGSTRTSLSACGAPGWPPPP